MYPVLTLFLLALNAAAIRSQSSPSCGNTGAKVPLYIAYYTSKSGTFVSSGTIPAVDLALELINGDDGVLPGYDLTYEKIYDTMCERSSSYNNFFEMINNFPPYNLAILGLGCSPATEPVAEITPYWNIPIMSYVSATPLLSERDRFPNFFRAYPSDINFVPAMISLVKFYGWKRILIITEEASVFLENHRPLVTMLEEENITVSENSLTYNSADVNITAMVPDLIFTGDPDNDVHLYFINVYEESARAILCAFYRQNIRYPNYMFITHGWYQTGWWSQEVDSSNYIPCSDEEMRIVLNRTLAIQQFPFAQNTDEKTVSGLSYNEFDRMYRERLGNYSYQFEATTAFDAAWALALALHNVSVAVCEGNDLGCSNTQFPNITALEDFEYYNDKVECMLMNSISNLTFLGVSGPVQFDVNGTRVQNFVYVFQYRIDPSEDNGISRAIIGIQNFVQNQNFIYENGENNDTTWDGGVPPPDGVPVEVINTYNTGFVVLYYILASIGILCAVACFIFTLIFRERKVIKLTSPNVNYFLAFACVLLYCSVYVNILPGLDSVSLALRCNVSNWFLISGYTLAFGCILGKMWRVYYIFHNPTPKKRTLKDWHLIMVALSVTAITLLLLLIGDAVPMLRASPAAETDRETSEIVNEYNVTVQYFVYVCTTETVSIAYQAIIIVWLFMMQVVGILLAFETRKVKIKVLNDAKYVTVIIYVCSILLVVYALSSLALVDLLHTNAVLNNTAIMVAASIFLGLNFVPKMISLYYDPDGKKVFSHETTTPSQIPANDTAVKQAIASLYGSNFENTDDPKLIISALEARIQELQKKLKHRGSATDVIGPTVTFSTPPPSNGNSTSASMDKNLNGDSTAL